MSGIRKVIKKIVARRPAFSTVAEVAGFFCVGYGVALFSMPVSFIVCGILLIVAGGLSA